MRYDLRQLENKRKFLVDKFVIVNLFIIILIELFILETDAKGDISTSAANPTAKQNSQNVKEQPQTNQTQKESTIIEPTDTNQKINPEQNNPASSEKEQKPKASWIKRLFFWIVNLFK